MKYYELDDILEKKALYNFIIGERSNGKTTAVLRHIVRDYYETGRRGAIVRQMEEDIKGHRGSSLFAGMVNAGMIEELTDGEYQGVKYFRRSFFLGKHDETGWTYEDEPFAHAFAISQSGHDKSISFPNVGTIMFDEFMRQDNMYLVDEPFRFVNLISTITREKDEAIIFLIANTVSWNSPYFKTFGLKNISQMKQGEIGVVKKKKDMGYGSVLEAEVAVEYCESTAKYGGKKSDRYLVPIADPRYDMITNGSFAVADYPPCPHHFTSENVRLTCWVLTDEKILRCRLMKVDRDVFFFVDSIDHRAYLPGDPVPSLQPDWERYEFLKDSYRDIVYSLEFTSDPSHFTDPSMPYADVRTRWFPDALRANRLFFASKECGAELMYYISQARRHSVTAL